MTRVAYLSQIVLPYESALQKGLRSSYDWHRWIWNSFPDDPDRKRDFLFRVDVQDRQVRILLLSANTPAAIENWTWRTKRVSDEFLDQRAYRFQVRINPTFRRSADHRRIALYKESDIHEWLKRKMSAIGGDSSRRRLISRETSCSSRMESAVNMYASMFAASFPYMTSHSSCKVFSPALAQPKVLAMVC